MGKYNKGILGPFMGKVGTVVGSVWNGVHYLRSLGDYVDNPTTGQLNARARVGLMVPFLSHMKSIISIGWFSQAKRGLTAMNAASSYHLKNAITGIAPAYAVDYPKVVISRGELDGAAAAEIGSAAGHIVDFSWESYTEMAYGKPTDLAVLLVYCEAENRFVFYRQTLRSVGEYSLVVPASFVGAEVQCWLAFFSADLKLSSDSVFLGAVTVLA